ncbi:hypothetical protein Hypma_014917 [Hypsizygus marmoreus]|uniref:Uncharacterized protein n=1 Tax=Hypsizygus marmoreus TaxID=39966 RepID=A0A369KC46_HYPMA|nr:hypothetical protein Hypma_014917 [Hypsizygus marmoreus]
MSDSSESTTVQVKVTVRLYDNVDPPIAEFNIRREGTLAFAPLVTNAQLHKISEQERLVTPLKISENPTMIFDPPCVATEPLKGQLPEECHTITAYLPAKLNTVHLLKENARLDRKCNELEAELTTWEVQRVAERQREKQEWEDKRAAERQEEKQEWADKRAAERKKEQEERETEYKKEQEEREAQRKKEQKEWEGREAKGDAECKNEKKEWEEGRAAERGREKAELEATEREKEKREQWYKEEFQQLNAQLADHAAVLLDGDTIAMDRIRLRNILDSAQTKLAEVAGLVSPRDDFNPQFM